MSHFTTDDLTTVIRNTLRIVSIEENPGRTDKLIDVLPNEMKPTNSTDHALPVRTIEHQLELFTNTWQQAVADLPLDAVEDQILEEFQAIVAKAFQNAQSDFDPLVWPSIIGLSQDVRETAACELASAVRKTLVELTPRILFREFEKIYAHLAFGSDGAAKATAFETNQSGGSYHG